MKKPADDISPLLHDAVKHLLARVANPDPQDLMTVAEETGAVKAGVAYLAFVHKVKDPNEEDGKFGGYSDIASPNKTSRRGNGRPPRDGATIDSDF